jgi:hypothetical protein
MHIFPSGITDIGILAWHGTLVRIGERYKSSDQMIRHGVVLVVSRRIEPIVHGIFAILKILSDKTTKVKT